LELNTYKGNNMRKGKGMWSIAICSSTITVLGLIVFFLLLQVLPLKDTMLSYAQKGTLAAGIYFAQRSYKTSRQQITYGQGVKVGFLTAFFTVLWISLLFFGIIVWCGKELISTLVGEGGMALQTTYRPPSSVMLALLYNSSWFLVALGHPYSPLWALTALFFYNPLGFLLIIFIYVLITGAIMALILSWFSKTKNKGELDQQQVVG
jgi:hypothetical protein